MSEGGTSSLVRFALDPETEAAPEELRRFILFQACDEWLGLPIQWVREIQPLERVTRVPNAAAEILGIVNLRGRVLTVFALAGYLGIPPGEHPESQVIILDVSDPELLVGLAVQRIAHVREVEASAIGAPPFREGSANVLEGVVELDGQVVGLLDLARVFARASGEWGVSLEARPAG